MLAHTSNYKQQFITETWILLELDAHATRENESVSLAHFFLFAFRHAEKEQESEYID